MPNNIGFTLPPSRFLTWQILTGAAMEQVR